MQFYGGIEAGGTKVVCAIGAGPHDMRAETRFPATTPEETIANVVGFFQKHQRNYDLSSIGIASFGPIDPTPSSPTYGYITNTPKPGWANFNFAGTIREIFDMPIGFDTDVNGAALGEHRFGAAQGLDTFVYLTIGTGLGGGGMVNGKLMHGLLHPEMGHMFIPHNGDADPYAGWCKFHGDCWEGLAAGPAIFDRWKKKGQDLPANHPAWELEAHYLALGLINIITTLSPQRIIMGGGVMEQHQLFPLIHDRVRSLLNGYIQSSKILERIDEYIVPPALGSRAGVLGAIALAEMAAKK